MTEQYTYAVSRIHSKELDLLTSSDLEQLMLCPDFGEAMRYLAGKGYGSGEEYSDFDALEADETKKLWALIDELVPDKNPNPFKTLLLQIDFHNLKAAIKAVYTSEEPEGYFLSGGTVEPSLILESVKLNKYGDLPEFLAETAKHATEAFVKTGDGQECDIYVDRACIEAIVDAGESSGIPIVREYAELLAALSDIKIAVRAALTNKNRGFTERALAKCGSIDTDTLSAAAAKNIDEVYKYLEHTDYREAVEKLKISMSEFEKWSDNRIMDLIKGEKHNPFTVAPIFAYILAKQNELKAVQIIISGKKNNLDTELVRERIRDLYV